MSDDLDDLKSALRAATPAPDATRRAANLALAQKNFDRAQGSLAEPRPKSDRPETGLWTGVRNMLNSVSSRGGLVATTALVAVGFVALTPMGDFLVPERLSLTPEPEVITVEEMPAEYAADEPAPKALVRQAPTALADAESTAVVGALAADQALQARRATLAPSPSPAPQAEMRARSGSVLMDPDDFAPVPEADTEAFANADSNPVHVTTETPVSTFSIDVDTASYSVVRSSLMNGYLPPSEAVRVEEMVNYFPYAYPGPEGDAPFQPTVSVQPTPWNADTQLLHIGIQGALPELDDRPALNLVFLIDTSGSMNAPNKLPLLKQSFALMLNQLRPEDQVAIVAYAGSAGQVLEPTAASDRATILAALNRLDAGGSTAGKAGLELAYATAAEMAKDGEIGRVVLATDGDFNVGISDPDALKDYIARQRDSGTYLSILGFGRGNLDDATMQALAQNGNGQAAYIDTLSEAQKVLVDQLSGALFPIANDVKIQVEFNPAQIAEYRLIGYETRALRREDFNNDAVDAGEIGAGHTVTALYEITPVGSPARLTDPLRYAPDTVGQDSVEELAFLRLRYKAPGSDTSTLIETPVTADATPVADARFAAAIAGFGQLLRGSSYLGNWSYADAIALANETRGADPFGYRTEAVQLMRLAESLSAQ